MTKTATKKPRLAPRRTPNRSDKPWKFTITLQSEGKRVSVRGEARPDADDSSDYLAIIKDMKGNVLAETVCWDQDEAVVDAAMYVFDQWANMA